MSHNFLNSAISDETFTGCNYSSVNFRGARLTNCRFIRCNFSFVKVDGLRLENVLFEGCKFVGVEFYKCEKRFLGFRMHECVLQACNFSDLPLKKLDFTGSKIHDCHFSNTNLRDADFSDTDLTGTLFHRCDLEKASFERAKNYLIDPATNNVKKARFTFPDVVNLLKCYDIIIN